MQYVFMVVRKLKVQYKIGTISFSRKFVTGFLRYHRLWYHKIIDSFYHPTVFFFFLTFTPRQAFAKKKVEDRKEWLTSWLEERKRRKEHGLSDVSKFQNITSTLLLTLRYVGWPASANHRHNNSTPAGINILYGSSNNFITTHMTGLSN